MERGGWVVVTGASGGIGTSLVKRLIEEGISVIAAVRDPANFLTISNSARLQKVELDLSDPETIPPAVRNITQITQDKGLAGLVNMAGIIVEGSLEAIAPKDFRRQMDINVLGPFVLTQALLPMLKQAKGTVVNVGAISAHLTVPFYGPIAASKSALASLNDAMRMEFAPLGIRVFLVEPGAINTGIFATSRAARDVNLTDHPALERHYRKALVAMDAAFDKAGADDPKVVVEAVWRALYVQGTKQHVIVGKGTKALLMLANLPSGLRDRAVISALGLSSALKRN